MIEELPTTKDFSVRVKEENDPIGAFFNSFQDAIDRDKRPGLGLSDSGSSCVGSSSSPPAEKRDGCNESPKFKEDEKPRSNAGVRTRSLRRPPPRAENETVEIPYPSIECYANIWDNCIQIIRPGVKSCYVPLQKRLVRILQEAYLDAQQMTRSGSESGPKDKPMELILTHDVIRRASEKPKRRKKSNCQDIVMIRNRVKFSDGQGLIGECVRELSHWKTTIKFRLGSERDPRRFKDTSLPLEGLTS